MAGNFNVKIRNHIPGKKKKKKIKRRKTAPKNN